jgi:hypothetical protein
MESFENKTRSQLIEEILRLRQAVAQPMELVPSPAENMQINTL